MLYMSERKVLYTVRMPIDLKRLLDSKADILGMKTSQYVLMACWTALEAGKPKQTDAPDVAFDPCVVRPAKPSMDALRAHGQYGMVRKLS